MTMGTVASIDHVSRSAVLIPELGGYVIVHFDAVVSAGLAPLTEGQRLSFDIASDEHGQVAVNLQAL